jgi:hypothetical protein
MIRDAPFRETAREAGSRAMTMVIRVVQKADAWLIELAGDYFGPLHSEDEAFAHANLTALKLQLEDFSADIRIEKQALET